MTRPTIGLALGSGGAKGLAHFGVLKVLKQHNIPIDFIAGASMGAVVGAYYALDMDLDALQQNIVQSSKLDLLKIISLVSPKKALLSGDRILSILGEQINTKSFSDTKIPFVIVATDMSSGKEVHFTKGSIIEAIRASISMPGIFPPARLGRKYYLDGGLVNPTPVDVVKDMGAEIVIGVDITTKKPVKIKDPNIMDTLLRSLEILRSTVTSLNIGEEGANTIIIRPNKSEMFDTYRFHNRAFIDEGEKVTRKNIRGIKKAIKHWTEEHNKDKDLSF